jgi:hypothetical protein
MSKFEKLEEAELTELQTGNARINELKRLLAENVIVSNRCRKDRLTLLEEFESQEYKYNSISDAITRKYGNVSIELPSGNIIYNS